MNHHRLAVFQALICAALFAVCSAARATDTIEAFDPGFADVELYTGAEGIGLGRNDRTVFGETVLAYGVVERFSVYLRATGSSNQTFDESTGETGLGVIGTPVDTNHFDFDLLADFSWAPGVYGAAPGIELNFDLKPDRELWGMYLRAEEAVEVAEPEPEPEPEDPNLVPVAQPPTQSEPNVEATTVLTLGTYWTLGDDHQILVEADAGIANQPGDGAIPADFGGVALGYNVVVNETIELVNQVFVDVPVQTDDRAAVGVSVGFIATVPWAPTDTGSPEAEKVSRSTLRSNRTPSPTASASRR